MGDGRLRRRAAATVAAALARLRPRSGKRVILFHEITDPARLTDTINWLTAECEILSLADLFGRPRGERAQVAITFDDGYRSWYDAAAPILEALSVPATFFVCSGFVGLRGEAAWAYCVQRLRRRTNLEPLTITQVQELAAHPLFAIGSHTVNHTDLGPVADRAVLDAEIAADRRRLEDWTGRPVRWFAYPFGQPENTSPMARTYLEEHEFAAGFTLVPSFVDDSDRFMVGRDSANPADAPGVWQTRLAGGFDSLYRLTRRLRGQPVYDR